MGFKKWNVIEIVEWNWNNGMELKMWNGIDLEWNGILLLRNYKK